MALPWQCGNKQSQCSVQDQDGSGHCFAVAPDSGFGHGYAGEKGAADWHCHCNPGAQGGSFPVLTNVSLKDPEMCVGNTYFIIVILAPRVQ